MRRADLIERLVWLLLLLAVCLFAAPGRAIAEAELPYQPNETNFALVGGSTAVLVLGVR